MVLPKDPKGVRALVQKALRRVTASPETNAQFVGRTRTLTQAVEEPEIIEENPPDASLPIVQSPPVQTGGSIVKVSQPGEPKEWVWTKAKREALKLTLEGMPIGKIAERTGRHRNSIRLWWSSPDFQKEVRVRMHEHATSMKLRQTFRAGTMGETLFNRAVELMSAAQKNSGKLDIGQAQLVFRELRDWQREEREIVDGNVQRIEKRVTFDGRMDVENSGGEGTARSKAEQNLVQWLEGYEPKLKKKVLEAKTQDELVDAMREVAMETDLIDDIQEAAREEQREQDAENASNTRKR